MKLATIVLLGILVLGSFASMQAADPAGAGQVVMAFTGGWAYTSDTGGVCMWYPLLLGDLDLESLFEFVDGAPAVDKEHAYLIWVSDFSAVPQAPFLLPPSSTGLFTLQLVPTGTATIYFTDRPRLRNWTDLTNRSTWGKPVATFVRKAGIFQSTDGGKSGTMTSSAELVSSKPFTLDGNNVRLQKPDPARNDLLRDCEVEMSLETMRPARASRSAAGSKRRVTIGSQATGGFSMLPGFESRPACLKPISGACCNMQPQRGGVHERR